VLGILVRPFGIGEWVWALAGALALTFTHLVETRAAFAAIGSGCDVYLFLAGMMLLSEIARREGVFDWLAGLAVDASRGSAQRLFALVYAAGTAVTIVLSNDATAIVLTPAVAAAVRRANVSPLPYVLACAFVANAASFVLPISNPANLIVFAGAVPALSTWLAVFTLPSIGAILVTFAVLWWLSRSDLGTRIAPLVARAELPAKGAVALAGISASALALLGTSAVRGPIGAVTSVAALLVLGAVGCVDRGVFAALRSVSWSILVLVASLFVLVAGLKVAGGIDAVHAALEPLAHRPAWLAVMTISFATGVASNLTNNLPLGVIAGAALARTGFAESFRYAAAIGVDLGPNLSVTGSLATILWLVALRREGIAIGALRFLRTGAIAMPTALAVAAALLALTCG
jgi:arsenical pump membrane protein